MLPVALLSGEVQFEVLTLAGVYEPLFYMDKGVGLQVLLIQRH
jgi:hypothetical protein